MGLEGGRGGRLCNLISSTETQDASTALGGRNPTFKLFTSWTSHYFFISVYQSVAYGPLTSESPGILVKKIFLGLPTHLLNQIF